MEAVRCCVVRSSQKTRDAWRTLSNKRGAALDALLWPQKQEISVSFLDRPSDLLAERVQAYAQKWTQYCNLSLRWVERNGDVRITFQGNGSWSYLGTECLNVPREQPTMCFGWLRDGSLEQEIERVVLHEFGHALGLIHEHQNPEGGIRWNREAVYAFYAGAPNFWKPEEVDVNVLSAYDRNLVRATTYDAASIMNYPIPPEFVLDPAQACGWNLTLSETDKLFIAQIYPMPVLRRTQRKR